MHWRPTAVNTRTHFLPTNDRCIHNRVKASVRAYEALRRDIVECRLEPGTMLAEVEQGARLGVSRTPVREALARLQTEGLAVQLPGRGVVVSDISADDLTSLFELRLALEVTAARLAAVRRDPAVFLDLADRCAAAAAVPPDELAPETCYALAAELDQRVDEATGNPYLVQALTNLRTHLTRLRRLAHAHRSRLAASAREHGEIAAAIASGEPDVAAAAVRLHLHHATSYITQALERKP